MYVSSITYSFLLKLDFRDSVGKMYKSVISWLTVMIYYEILHDGTLLDMLFINVQNHNTMSDIIHIAGDNKA